MIALTSVQTKHVRTTIAVTVLYSLLSGYYSYAVGGSRVVFTFCMVPYIFSLWFLIFTSPASGRAGFAIGATALLVFFGSLVTLSNDPKAGQLWWFYLFSVPIAAIGAGLASNFRIKQPRIRAELTSSIAATIIFGAAPYAFIAIIA